MNIREAFPDDIPLLVSVANDVWEPTYRHIISPEQIRCMMQDMHTPEAYQKQMAEGHRFFIALDDDRILGFISFHPHAVEASVMRIPKLYVGKSGQGKGIGSALIHALAAECLSMGMSMLELNVNRYNKALYFYRRIGFYIDRSEDLFFKGYPLSDYVLRKQLLT
jgi:GNAT superfamily N-acetyltransferase